MRLTILGSGTAVPEGGRGPTGLWLRSDSTSILVDCGSGTLQKLAAAGGSLATLDAVVLTHAHLDHTADLAPLLFATRLPEVRRSNPLRLLCSRGTARFVEGLRALYGHWLDPTAGLRVEALRDGDGKRVGDVAVHAFDVAHHESSLGFRFEGPGKRGVRVVVPGDTEPFPGLGDVCRDADLLVIECAGTDDAPLEGHMSPTPLAMMLEHARPKQVLVTHLYPEARRADVVREVQRAVTMPVREAEDGMEVRLGHADAAQVTTPGAARGQGARGRRARDEEQREADREIMRQALAELDDDALLEAKFGRSGGATGQAARRERGPHRVPRLWSVGDLERIELSGAQRQLAKRGRGDRTPTVNLRGLTSDEAERRLRETVRTWRLTAVTVGRIITGKGKRSEGDPVVKLMVLNWLDGEEGLRAVRLWAPERTSDGGFGTILVELAHS